MPSEFWIKKGIENARSPTTTPSNPHTVASLANFILPGSPAAVTNVNPAKINIIMAIPTNTGQMKLNIRIIICVKRLKALGRGGIGFAKGSTPAAKTIIGGANKTKENNKMPIFFSINALYLANYKLSVFAII